MSSTKLNTMRNFENSFYLYILHVYILYAYILHVYILHAYALPAYILYYIL